MKKNWPIYSNLEIKNVGKILSSGKVNFWTGSECKNFEKEFSNYFKIKYSTCVANGSLALECALKAIGVKKNDTVIVPSKSYFSSASCVVNVGATPIFSEVDLNTQNITKEFAEQVFKKNTKAIICVHLSGIPCEMDKIVEFAKKKILRLLKIVLRHMVQSLKINLLEVLVTLPFGAFAMIRLYPLVVREE